MHRGSRRLPHAGSRVGGGRLGRAVRDGGRRGRRRRSVVRRELDLGGARRCLVSAVRAELVLDPGRWKAALPGGVEGVFFFGEHGESQEFARDVRDAFVREYGLRQSDVPLMQMDLWPGITTPFRLVA